MKFQVGDLFIFVDRKHHNKGVVRRVSLYLSSYDNDDIIYVTWYDKNREMFINDTSYKAQDVCGYIESGDWEYYPVVK